ncbi:transcription elongation factor GreA [Aquamicrobium segne]|uniref:Transcription elongation factor GreA n=1 Tax=Aquamicrobium segne TaxID=469547 RepID=A0ABW0GV45_9HYPH
MSRAFTREEDNENAAGALGERPVSAHRNLVTARGLAMIEAELAQLQEEMTNAQANNDRERVALISRDLRYWAARHASAEVSAPEAGSNVVRFGMVVALEDEDGKPVRWRIVGEDEADPAQGSISHVSPMARALFGRKVGELVSVNNREWEIIGMSVEDD